MDNVIDLMMFLDVSRVYFTSMPRYHQTICVLWAIVTFIRTEDARGFLRWCKLYKTPFLKWDEKSEGKGNYRKFQKRRRSFVKFFKKFFCPCFSLLQLIT